MGSFFVQEEGEADWQDGDDFPEEGRAGADLRGGGRSGQLRRGWRGMDKLLLPLGELPVLVHTLRCFRSCPWYDGDRVVTREDLIVPVGQLCRDYAWIR